MTPKVLVFAGSVRTGAFSGKVADIAQKTLALQGAEVTRISLADYPLPIVDEDLVAEEGTPDAANTLARLVAAHDGVLIATPEYNGSMPPLLKNAIDWISLARAEGKTLGPWPGKVAAICSSSAGHFAGIRSAGHLRAVLAHMQVEVIAPQCSVPRGGEAFDENDEFKDERLRKSMRQLCETLVLRAWQSTAREGR